VVGGDARVLGRGVERVEVDGPGVHGSLLRGGGGGGLRRGPGAERRVPGCPRPPAGRTRFSPRPAGRRVGARSSTSPSGKDPMAAERIWLDVPFAEKDEAKALGARWDARRRRWYAPRAGMAGLDRWAAAPDVPDLLPGEDRSLGSGLYVDLVPSTCWFTNVRSCVSQRDWERLRRMVVGRAGRRCEVCGAAAVPAERIRLEVHERWAYDRASRVQTLKRLICLCTPCHTVTHFGLAQ